MGRTALFLAMLAGTAAQMAGIVALAYLLLIFVLALAAIAIPLPFFFMGVLGGSKGLIAIAGLLWIAEWYVLGAISVPMAAALDALHRRLSGHTTPLLLPRPAASFGERYAKGLNTVVWVIAQFVLLFVAVPVHHNFSALPVALLAGAYLVANAMRGGGHSKVWSTIMGWIAIAILSIAVASMFAPKFSDWIGRTFSVDEWLVGHFGSLPDREAYIIQEEKEREAEEAMRKRHPKTFASSANETSPSTRRLPAEVPATSSAGPYTSAPRWKLRCDEKPIDSYDYTLRDEFQSQGVTAIWLTIEGKKGCQTPILVRPPGGWAIPPFGPSSTGYVKHWSTEQHSRPIRETWYYPNGEPFSYEVRPTDNKKIPPATGVDFSLLSDEPVTLLVRFY
jgi:hypothetical protein